VNGTAEKPELLHQETNPADRLLTIREVAELTGLSVGTLYHFVSQGRLPVVRFSRRCIRFRLSSLQRWWDELSSCAGSTTRRSR